MPSPLPADVASALAAGQASGATTRPPVHSATRAHRLLTAATEAGVGALALSCLERIDLADLDIHDRVTYLRTVNTHSAWLEALQAQAVMGVAGPLDGWVSDEVEELIYEATTGFPLVRRDRDDADGDAADMPSRSVDSCGQQVSPTETSISANPSRVEPSDSEDAADMPSRSVDSCGQSEGDPLDGNPPTEVVLLDDLEPASRPIPKAWEFAECEGDAWNTREMATTAEVALATTVSKRTAGRRINTTRFLHSHPLILAMARVGRWGYGHLRVCEKELDGFADELIDTVLRDVASSPDREPPSRLAHRIRKSLARHDGPAMADSIRANREVIQANGWMEADGQGRIMLTADHTRISQALDALNDLADVRRAWLRAAGQPVPDAATLRGQLLLAAISTATSSSTDAAIREGISATPSDGTTFEPAPFEPAPFESAPRESARAKRRRKQAAIIVDLPTALGMSDEPGYIPGYGWVPADIARELAADSQDWSRWLIDDSSRSLLDINNTKYRPSEALRRFIAARAQECTMPVCSRPASDAQLDHADDFDGSNTTMENLHPACGPDHLIVTAGYFLVTLDEHGQATWTSTASGHSYDTLPSPVFDRPDAPLAADAPISALEAMTHRHLRDAA